METIGLIAAMKSESDALLRLVKGWNRTAIGAFRGYRFQMKDRDCLLVTSGMGLKHAADATRSLMEWSSPDLLISFGIAGAVNDDLYIGDVVVSGNSCLFDKGLPGQLHPLAALSEAAWNEAAQVLQPGGSHLFTGTAITTRGSQVDEQQLGKMPNPILEMETAGIAQVAAERGIPLLSIRSISDGPKSPIPLDLKAVMDEDYNFRIGRVLLLVLRRPQIIFQSRQVLQNSRKAANNAASALNAILDQSLPLIAP